MTGKLKGINVVSGISVDILDDRAFYRGHSLINEMHKVF
jgi:hypothetical protein